MTVKQMDLQQMEQELEAVDHKVKYQHNGSQWECVATYFGNIDEYRDKVTSGIGATKEAAAKAALDKVRLNKPELFACRQ